MYHSVKVSITSVLILLLAVSCSDSPSSSTDEPPQIPSAQSMNADFTYFNDQNNGQPQTMASDNFTRAFGTAVIMRAVVDINLAIPRALLTAAANADAELNADEEWEWNYSQNADGETYSVRLVASRQSDSEVRWDFYVTNSVLGLSDQLFFSGITTSDGRQGTWIYYDLQNPGVQQEVSRTDWSVAGGDDVTLRLDVTSDRNGNQGDFLEYMNENSVKNAVYYNAGEDETTEIEWNAESKAGFIISPDFNGGEQACWDENFQDIACTDI